jgi:predicted RNA-binding Zn ribbon-like protein
MDVGELELSAGNVVLDFVNTVEDRLEERPEDLLRTPADLAEWAAMSGVPAGRPPALRSAELARALDLRERLTALLDAKLDGRALDPGDLAALAAAEARAHAAGSLEQGEDGLLRWRWDPESPASLRHTIAAAASELLSGPDADRIGRCAGHGCGWFFLDATKRGNRRWCSMKDCGQAAKSANRRARRASRSR